MTYLLLFLITFLAPFKVHAQSVELSINPPVVEALVAPNKKFSQIFHFKTSQAGVVVIPELHLVKPDGVDGHSVIDPNPVEPSKIPLVVTSTPSFGSRVNLAGNDATFTLTFEAASSDLSQDVYLALVLRVEPVNIFEKSSVTSPAISALILTTITADGTYPISLEIQNFEPSLFHDSWLPLNIAPLLQNSSPFMIRPKGKYEVISPTGKTIYTTDLYPNLILGKSSRNLQSIVDDMPKDLNWQPKWSNIGPHKLKLTIETQGGTKLSQVEKLVWIIPLRILIVLALLFIIIYRLTRPKQPSTLDSIV
jgi:hypothetical protein